MKRRTFLWLLLLASSPAGCATLEPNKPIHQVDHARYQYFSEDSGSGGLLGYHEDGSAIYGARRSRTQEKWWRDSHADFLKSQK